MFRVAFFYSPEFPWVKCSLTQLSGSLHLQLWMGMAHLRSGFPGDVPVPLSGRASATGQRLAGGLSWQRLYENVERAT